MRKNKTDNQPKAERICDACANLYVHQSGCNEWCTARFWQRDYSWTRLSGVDKTCWQYKKLPEEKGDKPDE